MPRIMLVWITGCASGLRQSASIAFDTSQPMPMATPAPMYRIESSVRASSGISAAMSIVPPLCTLLCLMRRGDPARRRRVRFLLVPASVPGHRQPAEDERQHGEHEGLDGPPTQ